MDSASNVPFLVASIAALASGPVLFTALERSRRVARAVRQGLLAALVLLVAAGVLPECIEHAGGWAVLAALSGIALPALAERAEGTARRPGAPWLLILIAGALAVHAFADGAALASPHGPSADPDHGHGHALGWAIVLHHFPEGAALFALLAPRGAAVAWLGIGGSALASVLGFVATSTHLAAADATAIALMEAFVGGAILHTLLDASASHARPLVSSSLTSRLHP
jgi:uncharacterized protein